ncbi:hypothetical protein [Spirosoma radiotolerans]|uniref:Uncharacterized protein n=1 Tax=Spirosoma radiotolerans TaxID=1379870 RepID=A0A0E3ZUX7_9BACT|nr:hypothetical protein [Spirosoma radiotolerans]AKD54788.1 hypothetical protein SD10_07590 [Spirosoma radiotolerans]
MNRYSKLYFPDDAHGIHGAGTGSAINATGTKQVNNDPDAVDDGNETGNGDDWKEGDDWDNFGDEEVSDNISETGNA